MTAIITKDKIETNSWTNVYGILNDRNNIADPRGSSAEKRTFIYDSDPLAKSLSFADYPYMILEFPSINYSRVSENGAVKLIGWKHDLIIRTAKEGASGGNVDRGRSDMFVITDALHTTFNSATIKQQFADLNMKNVKLDKVSSDVIVISERTVYESRFEIRYDVRMTVA